MSMDSDSLVDIIKPPASKPSKPKIPSKDIDCLSRNASSLIVCAWQDWIKFDVSQHGIIVSDL